MRLSPFALSSGADDFSRLISASGVDSFLRRNVIPLGDDAIVFVAGNTLQRYDVGTAQTTLIRAFGIHNANSFTAIADDFDSENDRPRTIAVAQSGAAPMILLLSDDFATVKQTLMGGTEHTYSALAFSADGSELASVGAAPDFTLTIWDVKSGKPRLQTKAFGADVFHCQFSRRVNGRIITSGAGHIRFWHVADTFTGLKLKGLTGKFGAVSITDIDCFDEMTDGRVVSGSDSGYALIWDSTTALISERIGNAVAAPLHAGAVHFIRLNGDSELITAGDDGYMRWWNIHKRTAAESDADSIVACEVVAEVPIGVGARIQSVRTIRDSVFAVHDVRGGIVIVDTAKSAVEHVRQSYGGAVTTLSSCGDSIVSGTADGRINRTDFLTGNIQCTRELVGAVTASAAVKSTASALVAVGCADGAVRLFAVFSDAFILKSAIKPHNARVTAMAISAENVLATAADDGAVFFANILVASDGATIDPIGFVRLSSSVTSMDFHPTNARLVVGADNALIEIDFAAHIGKQKRTRRDTDSWTIACPQRSITPRIRMESADDVDALKLRIADLQTKCAEAAAANAERFKRAAEAKLRRERARLREIDRPYIISAVAYSTGEDGAVSNNEVVFAVRARTAAAPGDGEYISRITQTLFTANLASTAESPLPVQRRSLASRRIGDVSALRYSSSRKFLCVGFASGAVHARPVSALDYFFEFRLHSSAVSAVVSSDDDTTITSAAADGTIFTHFVDVEAAMHHRDSSVIQRVQIIEQRLQEKAAATAGTAAASAAEIEDDVDDDDADALAELAVVVLPIAPILIPSPPPITVPFTGRRLPLSAGAVDGSDMSSSAYSLEDDKSKCDADEQKRIIACARDEIAAEIAVLSAEFVSLAKRTHSEDAKPSALALSGFSVDSQLREEFRQSALAEMSAMRADSAYEYEKHALLESKLLKRFFSGVECESVAVTSFRLRPPIAVTTFRLAALSETSQQIIAQHRRVEESAAANAVVSVRHSVRIKSNSQSAVPSSVAAIGDAEEKSGETANQRRQRLRDIRMARLNALRQSEPTGQTFARAEDNPEYADAERAIGDYKLKSAADYVVPSHRRLNASTKQIELISLLEHIYAQRKQYNRKVDAVRTRKQTILQTIRSAQRRMRVIANALRQDHDATLFADIKYDQTTDSVSDDVSDSTSSSSSSSSALTDSLQRRRLISERETLISTLQSAIAAFDVEIAALRSEQFDVELAVKYAEAVSLHMYGEWHLLHDFEAKESALHSKLNRATAQRAALDKELSDVERAIEAKQRDLTIINDKHAAIVAHVQTICGFFANAAQTQSASNGAVLTPVIPAAAGAVLLPLSSDVSAVLFRVFKRRIKRRAHGATDGDDSDVDDADGDDGGAESDGAESQSDSDGEHDDVCPPQCDPHRFDLIVAQRDKRVEMEESADIIRRSLIESEKSRERVQSRLRAVERDVFCSNDEIAAFEREKQLCVNKLRVELPIRLKQFHVADESGRPPETLANALFFPAAQFDRLTERILTIRQERSDVVARVRTLSKSQRALLNALADCRALISAEGERCRAVQTLKFGSAIDLDILNQIGAKTTAIDALRASLAQEESAAENLVSEWDEKRRAMSSAVERELSSNTALLSRVAALTADQLRLESELNAATADAASANGATDAIRLARARRESSSLIGAISSKQAAIESARSEIQILRRKSGHLYAQT